MVRFSNSCHPRDLRTLPARDTIGTNRDSEVAVRPSGPAEPPDGVSNGSSPEPPRQVRSRREPAAADRHPGHRPPDADPARARRGRRTAYGGLRHGLPRLADRLSRGGMPAPSRHASPTTFCSSGLNEDLAATALWGSQQAELRGEGKYDGVFGVWYGKGPGLDRTGDVFRHANHAGTSKHGGVLALMGDDHTCESSTSAHQSEFAFVDYMIPVLNPGRRAGDPRLRHPGLRAVALCRRVGRHQVRQGQHRGHRDRRRPHRPRPDQDPRRFRDAAGRPQHPPRRPGARQGGAPARLQARRHPRLRPRQQARPHRHQRRREPEDRHHHLRQELSRRARRRSTSSASTR